MPLAAKDGLTDGESVATAVPAEEPDAVPDTLVVAREDCDAGAEGVVAPVSVGC